MINVLGRLTSRYVITNSSNGRFAPPFRQLPLVLSIAHGPTPQSYSQNPRSHDKDTRSLRSSPSIRATVLASLAPLCEPLLLRYPSKADELNRRGRRGTQRKNEEKTSYAFPFLPSPRSLRTLRLKFLSPPYGNAVPVREAIEEYSFPELRDEALDLLAGCLELGQGLGGEDCGLGEVLARDRA